MSIHLFKQNSLAYWNQRTPRERLFVALAAFSLIVTGFYNFYWKPMNRSIETLRDSIPRERAHLAEMRVQAKQVSRQEISIPTESLMPTLEKSLVNHGIRETLGLMEPGGDNLARLNLSQVNYVELVKWLRNLQRQFGIHVQTAMLVSTSTPGVVDAKLVLASRM